MKTRKTKKFYNGLTDKKRSTFVFSCGFNDRFDPELLGSDKELLGNIDMIIKQFFNNEKRITNNILDVGCGTFFYHTLFDAKVDIIAGIDVSFSLLQAGSHNIIDRINRTLLCNGDVSHLPFAKNSFDIVFSMDVLHHVEYPHKVLYEIQRILKPNGVYLCIEPNMCNPCMLLAHIIPSEERKALKMNWPFRFRLLFKQYFHDVRVSYYNLCISHGISKRIDKFFPFDANKNNWWSLRMAIIAQK